MKKIVVLLFSIIYLTSATAQTTSPQPPSAAPKEEKAASLTIPFNPDNQVVTQFTTTIKMRVCAPILIQN